MEALPNQLKSLGDHLYKSLEMDCKRGEKFAEKMPSIVGVSFIPRYLRFFCSHLKLWLVFSKSYSFKSQGSD